MSQQLVKKGANGRYDKVMPKSWIEAIKDKNTGQTLVEILQGFNMYFLPYNGNTSSTRCLVPTMLRKKGLWITYVKYDGNVYTEWYAADEIDDKSWGDSSNWRIGNNTLVGDITISANGNWVINGTETEFKAVGEKGNTPLIRVANNRLQVSYDLGDTYMNVAENPVYTQFRNHNNKIQVSTDLGATWTDASDEIAAYFRWQATSGDTQANNVGRVQISRDNKTWVNLSNDIVNNLHISRYIGVNESLPTSGIAEGTIYAKGPYYAEDDALNDNPIYRLWVYAWKGNTLAWQDNGEFTSIAAGIVQELGDNENAVVSQKAVTEKLSELELDTSKNIADFANEIVPKINNLELDAVDDTLYVTDSQGNVISKIDKNGIHVTEVNAKNINSDNDGFYIVDSQGYIAFKVSSDGVVDFNGKGIDDDGLKKYTLFSLGDSLSTSGIWQNEVSRILGVEFDNAINTKAGAALSVGGTTSFGEDMDNMPWRAKNLIDGGYIENEGENAIIVLENVNDIPSNPTFDKDAKSYNLDKVFECLAADWGEDFLASIPSSERMINSAIRLKMTISGKNLSISNLPSKEGDVILRIYTDATGNIDYGIHVLATDTINDIVNKILEYNYTKVTDTIADDGISVDFSGSNLSITYIDQDNTGLTVSINDTDNAKFTKMKYYNGTSLSEWADTSKWITGISFSEGWKTTIEMLQKAYPKAHIFVAMFPAHGVTASEYLKPNGLYDTALYSTNSRVVAMNSHKEVLASIADFYNLPYADVYSECGIGINNLLTYYNATANVHPMNEGYIRFGTTLANIIKRNIN